MAAPAHHKMAQIKGELVLKLIDVLIMLLHHVTHYNSHTPKYKGSTSSTKQTTCRTSYKSCMLSFIGSTTHRKGKQLDPI